MKDNHPTLLIWDIDGTLLTCRGSGKRAMTLAFLEMMGIDNGFDSVNMAGRVDRSILDEACSKHSVLCPDVDAFYARYADILKNEMTHNGEAHVFEGVLDVLSQTHISPQFTNVIGTGNCEQGAWLKLRHLGLDSYFETGGFGTYDLERVDVIKRAINNAMQHYGKQFDNTDKIYIVGDTPADIQCGKLLQVKTIAIATGGYTRIDLEAYQPDFVLDSLREPETFLQIFES